MRAASRFLFCLAQSTLMEGAAKINSLLTVIIQCLRNDEEVTVLVLQ